MAEVELEYVVCGEGTVFPVTIARDTKVSALQEKIFEKERYRERYKFDASELTMYLARKKGKITWIKLDRTVKTFLRGDVNKQYMKMRSSWKLNKKELLGPDFQPGEEEIHVLVRLPEAAAGGTMVDQGWTTKWLNEFRKNQLAPHQLPRLGELAEFIESEIPGKITLHQEIYDTWISKMTSPSPELMATLFKIDNPKQCVNFLFWIGSRIVYATDPSDTKTSFILFWDDLIRNVLNFVLHDIGKSERNSSREAPTGSNRPNYLFIVDSVCVFAVRKRTLERRWRRHDAS